MPIPASAVQPAPRSPLAKPDGEVWLMMLGFVNEYKGHLLAIKALSHLPKNYRLVIAGGRHPQDPSALDYWSRLLAMVDFCRVRDRVTFTGFIADEREYAAVLAQADAFLFPYEEVGQSASAALADVMSFSKPIVTSTARSMFEYRHELDTYGCAFAANVEESDEFAEQIEFVLHDSQQQAPLFKKHIEQARHNFSMEAICSRYEQIYDTTRRVA